ncbi:hypothetical protein BLNAU_6636 [Blattamonas nauphoetae]|uniref:Uncharacterized protein n=1 Tax=Blattamonas nauphoetae TaxID=2049346 RepID=A0ABQ9Y3T0_9EUKA|nr:hypothetical protein BLNAU_6636 [Blattamonas nauphoetae]
MDCSPFLNWNEGTSETESEKAVVFRSLVATLKIQPALDVTLEAKVVTLLESVNSTCQMSPDGFLRNFASSPDDSLTPFVQSLVVLISSSSQEITTATMEMLDQLILMCSAKSLLALVNADLIPQLINNLNPLSLSFVETVDIHINLLESITCCLVLATPDGLKKLEIKDDEEEQDVHETVFQQVLIPSEKYIRHLCVNRFSIISGNQTNYFLDLLTQLIQICPYYQPAVDFLLDMPVALTISSCLTFFDDENSIWNFLCSMNITQQEWNETREPDQLMWKTAHRMLRMEGIEDVVEDKLLNDKNIFIGEWLVESSIEWNNLLGMNL